MYLGADSLNQLGQINSANFSKTSNAFKGGLISEGIFSLFLSSKNVSNHYPQPFHFSQIKVEKLRIVICHIFLRVVLK